MQRNPFSKHLLDAHPTAYYPGSVTRFFQGKLPHPVSEITTFELKLPRCHIFAIFPYFSQFFHIFFIFSPKMLASGGGGKGRQKKFSGEKFFRRITSYIRVTKIFSDK